jgi:hypothetical protein
MSKNIQRDFYTVYRDGYPCSHPGCLQHITHPCEGCGRVGGRKIYPFQNDVVDTVFAFDEKDAETLWEEACGEPYDAGSYGNFGMVADETIFSMHEWSLKEGELLPLLSEVVHEENGNDVVKAPLWAWARTHGRGFFGSTEF